MTMKNKALYAFLTYAGALPFVICMFFISFGISQVFYLPRFDHIVSSYALVILSFLAGVHWGIYLYKEQDIPINLFVLSNVVTLFAWFAFLFTTLFWQLVIFSLSFALLLRVDYSLFRQSLITLDYFQTRCNVTSIVILSLCTILLKLGIS
ncbi:MAG: DUF3429 domain-containing protein [Pseudomonadota bacterium]